ncbi:hypothetical protein [Pelagibacterium sp.]
MFGWQFVAKDAFANLYANGIGKDNITVLVSLHQVEYARRYCQRH